MAAYYFFNPTNHKMTIISLPCFWQSTKKKKHNTYSSIFIDMKNIYMNENNKCAEFHEKDGMAKLWYKNDNNVIFCNNLYTYNYGLNKETNSLIALTCFGCLSFRANVIITVLSVPTFSAIVRAIACTSGCNCKNNQENYIIIWLLFLFNDHHQPAQIHRQKWIKNCLSYIWIPNFHNQCLAVPFNTYLIVPK